MNARMKLQQGQVWQVGEDYLRIVHLERLEVKYKLMRDLVSGSGPHHHVTKKEFCRLIKHGVMCSPAGAQVRPAPTSPAPSSPAPEA